PPRDGPREFFGSASGFTRYGDESHSRCYSGYQWNEASAVGFLRLEVTVPTLDPLAEYQTRLARWRGQFDRAQRQSNRIGNYRLGVFLAALAMAWFSFVAHAFAGWWLLVPLAVFAGLIVEHE